MWPTTSAVLLRRAGAGDVPVWSKATERAAAISGESSISWRPFEAGGAIGGPPRVAQVVLMAG